MLNKTHCFTIYYQNKRPETDKTFERDRKTQKCYGLLNKTHCFTIYYQNKRLETDKIFERERKMDGLRPKKPKPMNL